MQLTHRANYAAAGRALGYDYVSNPDVSEILIFEVEYLLWIRYGTFCLRNINFNLPCNRL